MGIDEDDFDDLVFEEDEAAPKQGIKWMALLKVHSANQFSPISFEQHMHNAWSPAQRVEFNHLEGNMFTIQCFCLGDWLKITEEGPWLFRQNAVCIEEYDGFAAPETIDLNHIVTWIQIHKLPVGYRNKAFIKNLTEKKVGQVLKVETDVNGMGNFVRVRVRLDVRNVLTRAVSISRNKEREIYLIQYEKIPKFCGACGYFGHSYLECGTGEHDESKLKWGDFLKADWDTWHGRSFGARGGGRGGGRTGRGREGFGGGVGRDPSGRGGPVMPWRHNALFDPKSKLGDPALKDTATSPVKGQVMDLDLRSLSGVAAKRPLEMSVEENVPTDAGLVGTTVNMDTVLTDGKSTSDISEEGDEKDRTKRTRKAGAVSPSLGSAGSQEDLVRPQ
jgi:hypothetical protein